MVAIEDYIVDDFPLDPTPPLLKPIDLKNIGYLQKIPTHVDCPACRAVGMSVVRLEAVTCLQKFLKATNLCKTAECRYDINHYCGECGCYIGRYVAIDCAERCLSKQARKKAASDALTLRKEPTNCAKKLQASRERVLANMTKERSERKQKSKEKSGEKENDKSNK
ncbi:uncharacterized protein LOC101891835 [Musca domestica]|uniref:Uncharacterized protein LOC101891835 n=1 Tax=Musca domestica TaxID=7370 RepID=A0A1I8M3Q8_MUSDO|nr:uncharacterized protein LOC101891835 [Musca domestica]